MNPPEKILKNFPLGSLTSRDKTEHASFLSWVRLHHSPRYTESIHIPGTLTRKGFIFQAQNGARIGFALSRRNVVELVHLHPESSSWFHLELNTHSFITQWREDKIDDGNFRFHRRHAHRLFYRLFFWKTQFPSLTEYLGCQSDLRLITRFNLIFNYAAPLHEQSQAPENHPRQLDFSSLLIPP